MRNVSESNVQNHLDICGQVLREVKHWKIHIIFIHTGILFTVMDYTIISLLTGHYT